VAVDYLHVMKKHVFEKIEVVPFERAKAKTSDHEVRFTFHKSFPDELARGLNAVLFSRSTLASGWCKIPLGPSAKGFEPKKRYPDGSVAKPTILTLAVAQTKPREFYEWLSLGWRSGHFVSFGFDDASGLKYGLLGRYIGNWKINASSAAAYFYKNFGLYHVP
jgi:hypothetical protein